MRNKKRPKFFVGFKSTGTDQVLRRSAFIHMTIFRTEPELYSFGAGWIFSSAIPEAFRLAVDRDISNVSLNRELQEIAKQDAGTFFSPNCKKVFWDIGIGIVGILILICTVPCFVLLIVILCWYYLKRILNPRRKKRLRISRLALLELLFIQPNFILPLHATICEAVLQLLVVVGLNPTREPINPVPATTYRGSIVVVSQSIVCTLTENAVHAV